MKTFPLVQLIASAGAPRALPERRRRPGLRGLSLLLLVATIAGLFSAPLARAQELGPALPTGVETPQPTPLPTTPAVALVVTGVEPKTMINGTGGILSVYGAGFTAGSAVRLIGYGLLSTSYVNSTAVTAQVPAGVPAGVYDLQVGDGTQTDTLSRALSIAAPTPTPKPAAPSAPPPPGRPILTIRNYAVEPAQVRPGQEFVVTVEIYNNGSRAGENTLAVFPGDPFLPVGEPGHMIGQIHINHVAVVTQRMRVPSTVGGGIYQLMVNLGTNDWEGNHYDYPQPVPVEVVGSGASAAPTGKPRLVVEKTSTEPAVLAPGAPFTLTLQLANLGSRTAVDVFVAAASGDAVIPAAGGGTASMGRVGVNQAVTVTFPLLLSDVETGGRQILPIVLDYTDASGGTYSEQQNLGVDVDTGLSRRPQLVIAEYTTAPDFLTPGDTFTLTMRVGNVGGGDAERLTLALGGDGGAHLEPFIPLKAGNVIFVPAVEAGSVVEITRQLVVDGSADAKAYNLPIALAYDDPRGSRETDVQRLSLVVRRRPELQAALYREPEGLAIGSPTALSLEMTNVGLSAVNVVQITASSPQMTVEAEGTPFVGPVEMGGSAPLDVTVTPRQGGSAELVVTVTYRDDFNQLQTLTRTLTVDVPTGPGAPMGPTQPGTPGQAPEDQNGGTLWAKLALAIRGFLGFGS